MDATLTVIGGKTSKPTIKVKKLPAVIGRGKGIWLTIAHPMVSRRHCELFEKGGVLIVRDLGSLNGTLVSGRRIKESPLPPGGEFSIGPLSFRVQYQFKGDQKSLPATVWAEPAAAEAAAEAEPDFEDVDDTSPVPPKTAKPVKTATPRKAAHKGDADEISFFEELGLDNDADEPAVNQQLATTRSVSQPGEAAAAETPRPGAIKPAPSPLHRRLWPAPRRRRPEGGGRKQRLNPAWCRHPACPEKRRRDACTTGACTEFCAQRNDCAAGGDSPIFADTKVGTVPTTRLLTVPATPALPRRRRPPLRPLV